MQILENYLSEKELADALGVTRRTVQRWRLDLGEGPPITRIGARIYFRAEAVRDWLLRHERRQPRERTKGAA
jgi:transcriptional regulator with XRE-family HTH domain